MLGYLTTSISIASLLLKGSLTAPTLNARSVTPVTPVPLNLSLAPIISAFGVDLPRFSLFEQYSAAAYDKAIFSSDASPADEVKIKVRCTAQNCPLVESADAVLYLAFDNPAPVNVAGFVAVDRTNRVIVLSFRGTDSFANFLEDVDVWGTDWSQVCHGCMAHNGFSTAWENIADEAVAAILAAGLEFPGYTLVITGHSLGAAIATLAAADLRHAGYTCALYNYGSPKAGNHELAAYISAQQGGNYRITHLDDPVPQLPPSLPQMSYGHIEPEYWIKTGNDVPVTAADIVYLANGGGDVSGLKNCDVEAHCFYFNHICGADKCPIPFIGGGRSMRK